ncbi:MAG: 4Fe-4S dicluster domain-containing protein [Firmicutes bacterium]|nr:4Fe-4S dicluster domain-containing protein [Bacillota bacterium]
MPITAHEALCSGCRTCEILCALTHFKEMNPKKAAIRVEGEFPVPGRFRIHLCDQCGKCAEACLAGAIGFKDSAYVVDDALCTGCRACVSACPSSAVFVHPDLKAPIICNQCGECVEWCPRGVLAGAGRLEGGEQACRTDTAAEY